jgi:hypothetical protein
VPPVYQSSIAGETMNIFRYAFAGVAGEETASNAGFVLFIFGVGALGALLVWNARVSSRPPGTFIATWILFCGMVFLFSPYSGAYEDLLLVPLILLWFSDRSHRLPIPVAALVLAALFVSLNFVTLRPLVGAPVLWVVKALLFVIPLCLLPFEIREHETDRRRTGHPA